MTKTAAIIEENEARKSLQTAPYDPLRGVGSVHEREKLHLRDAPLELQYLPKEMFRLPFVALLQRCGTLEAAAERLLGEKSPDYCNRLWLEFVRLRIRYDFEFWAILFARIKNKLGASDIPFRLCAPQRKLLEAMEQQRVAHQPIRIILLKARQWGGSTLVQIYMAWMQLTQKSNWNSTICAHVKNAAQNIKGMYSKLMLHYPPWLLYRDKPVKFTPYEKSASASIIEPRGCKVVIGSAESPNSVRGEDASMAHCTEVAFWNATDSKTPEDIIRSVIGGIAYLPDTVIVYESTANGTGNFFYREWMRARNGESDKKPLFVAWFEIEMYALPITDYSAFIETLGDYEWWLWDQGATLEAIAWYRQKRKEYRDPADMMAEYPSDDVEAFKHSGNTVFNIYCIADIEKGCIAPEWCGELQGDATKGAGALANLRFLPDEKGALHLWQKPDTTRYRNRYLVVVDVGGRSAKADYSVVAVFDRYWLLHGGKPEIVAQWRGHIDHDMLAWKAAQIAHYYQKALLVIESNTFETDQVDSAHSGYILDLIALHYDNLYCRTPPGAIREGVPQRWGFHTNVSTKNLVVDSMIETVRENDYIERDALACHEMAVYERRPNGSYGAKEGCHDDVLMTRMIGIYVSKNMDMPRPVRPTNERQPPHAPLSEATL